MWQTGNSEFFVERPQTSIPGGRSVLFTPFDGYDFPYQYHQIIASDSKSLLNTSHRALSQLKSKSEC